MKHIQYISRNLPSKASSAAENQAMFTKIAGMVTGAAAALTSVVGFYNLLALPAHQIDDAHKGI